MEQSTMKDESKLSSPCDLLTLELKMSKWGYVNKIFIA